LVLGVILGPIAEENLNRALLMSKNSLTVFYTRPISLVFLLLAAFTIVFSLVSSMKKAKA
jgi:putative tricarboxylic transport membrane protein